MGELIRVIVPVYNVEKYLKACMQSIWSQTQDSVGLCMDFRNRFTWKRYLDDFDYVTWFNQIVIVRGDCK